MSASERIAVVGTAAFAGTVAETAHRQAGREVVGVVAPGEALPDGAGLVISVAPPSQRLGVVEQAVAARLPVVTLPLPSGGERAERAVSAGVVAQVSVLRGFSALETLRREVGNGALGRRYSLFAAYRVRQGSPDVFDVVGLPVLHYATSVLGEAPVVAQVTRAGLFGGQDDAWFAILRCADGTVATVEFAASLPASAPADLQLLVEANGSDAVLRAEPTRQAVSVAGSDGSVRERGWWTDPAREFALVAIEAAGSPDPARELAWLRFVDRVRQAGVRGEPVGAGA